MIERSRINSDSVGFEFVVTVEFAGQLERELTQAQRDFACDHIAYIHKMEECQELRRQMKKGQEP